MRARRAGRVGLVLGILLSLGACGPAPTPSPPAVTTPAVPTPAAQIYNVTGAGGTICRGAAGAAPCTPAAPASLGYADDTIAAAPAGTLGVQATAVKIRLLATAQLLLKARSSLDAPQQFLLAAGQALFLHENAAGEIEVAAGQLRIQPLDTAFSVDLAPSGAATVAVLTGTRGVVITGTTVLTLPAGQQVTASPDGQLAAPQPLDPHIQALWDLYAIRIGDVVLP
ncbi:MAG TPA: hypothetical protein VKY74_04355 [Chloroflexia bacterium]|nr:hypothetical protein [Chloroflexia bacterium]